MTKGNHLADINLIVHEILHILGINFNCFKMYPSKDGKGIIRQGIKKSLDGKLELERYFLVSENIVKTGQSHFNCPSLSKSKFIKIKNKFKFHWKMKVQEHLKEII